MDQSTQIENPSASVTELRQSITTEAFKAIGIKPGGWREKIFSALFWLPAQRFARMGAEFDKQIEEEGVTAGLRKLLPRFARRVETRGVENIPPEGPLLVVSNHPGAFDGVVIVAQFQRDDIKVIISDVPFTRGMKAATKHMIYSTGDNMQERMNAVRQSVRHLQDGGALMLFPTGVVDPDPSFMPGADQALNNWSESLEFFICKVPETRVLPVIVSGVIAPKYMNNYFARRQKTVRSRQKVAEYFEIVQLMVIQRDLGLFPRVSFGQPLTIADLGHGGDSIGMMGQINRSARELLADHIAAAEYPDLSRLPA
jgi:hypothetical protein